MYDPVIDRAVSAKSGEYQYHWHFGIRRGERMPARCSVCSCELISNPMTVYQQVTLTTDGCVSLAYTCSAHYCRNRAGLS